MTKKEYKAAIKARRGAYEALLDNATDACFNEEGKVIVKIGFANVDLLEIDARYQGDRRHKSTQRLMQNWDWRKYDMITVVPHKETCSLSVVDGQNRTKAAKLKGIKKLPVKIICGCSKNEEERLKTEAELFIKQNDETDIIQPVEMHKALLIMGDKAAIDLDEILQKYKVSYIGTPVEKWRKIHSYPDHIHTARTYGKECLEFIYSTLNNAEWIGTKNGLQSRYFRVLKRIYAVHDTEIERTVVARFLSRYLRDTTPDNLCANAVSRYPLRTPENATLCYVEDVLIEAGIVERAIEPLGERETKIIKTSERRLA